MINGHRRSHWLLHEVQDPARDQERQADHDEERPAGHRGFLPGLQYKDLQNRGNQVGPARNGKVGPGVSWVGHVLVSPIILRVTRGVYNRHSQPISIALRALATVPVTGRVEGPIFQEPRDGAARVLCFRSQYLSHSGCPGRAPVRDGAGSSGRRLGDDSRAHLAWLRRRKQSGRRSSVPAVALGASVGATVAGARCRS